MGASESQPIEVASSTRQESNTEELSGSLEDARQAFVLALDSLLQPYLSYTTESQSGALDEAGPLTPGPRADPFVDPTAILAPLRKQSLACSSSSTRPNSFIATTGPPAIPPADLLTSNLVASLQQRTARHEAVQMQSTERLSSAQMSEDNRVALTLVDELQVQVDLLARKIPTEDAELARALGSLVACIDRLAALSKVLDGLTDPEFSSRQGERAVGAAVEVECAERDLLWGRVDDLSERVRLLTRQRAGLEAPDTGRVTATESLNASVGRGPEFADLPWTTSGRQFSWDAASISSLPTYQHEHDLSSPPLLPGYYDRDLAADQKASIDREEKVSASLSSGQASSMNNQLPSEVAIRQSLDNMPSSRSEKMQRDLDSVSQAIERLYIVSPQLANQRVEPDRRLLRERQLAKLGNAIERLSQGRLNDQRAASIPLLASEPETQAEKSRREQKAVDLLIERIDKAASRTLADQRSLPLSDSREAQRRENILGLTGKGRLAGQDAVLHSSSMAEPFPRPPLENREEVTISEFFSEEQARPRTADAGLSTVQLAGRQGYHKLDNSNRSEQYVGEALRGRRRSLGVGMLKGLGSRRGSTVEVKIESPGSTTRADPSATRESESTAVWCQSCAKTDEAKAVLTVSQFDHITEESRNLGSLAIAFWPRERSGNKAIKDDYVIVSVESEAVAVGPARGGPASRLSFPTRVTPQHTTIADSGSYHEIKVDTLSPSPTRPRADLEVHTPLSTGELRDLSPPSFACAKCHTELVDSATIIRYNALPSEHWAELLDAWMCHPDQTLSQDLISKGNGIKPREDEGLVGTTYILFPADVTKNWTTPESNRPPERLQTNEHLHPAHCTICSSLVGYHVTSPISASQPNPTSFRLLKYASYPVQGTVSHASTPRTEYSLSCHLTAEMLETSQAKACHRFIIEDFETETPRLFVWFFNPAIRVAFSHTSVTAHNPLQKIRQSASSGSQAATQQSLLETTPPDTISRVMNAVKVFYADLSRDPEQVQSHDLDEYKTETMTYPRAIVDRLMRLLEASTLVYPPAKRIFGDLQVGFLERI
ncbi:putative polyadenylation protein [Sporobolomyces koalae]|uniref:putative polyadenylation protein n=1 Tax=Sporobolomyces koalae TaxID=500713 RepID=UPI00317B2AE8